MTDHDQPKPGQPVPAAEPSRLRVSDVEREAVAARLREATGEGRLTLAEAEERQSAAYAARFRDDLPPLTADLPEPEPATSPRPDRRAGPLTDPARRRLIVHAVLVAVLAALLVARWALDPAPWFWPGWPLFWLGVSLVVHYRRAPRDPAGTPALRRTWWPPRPVRST